MKNNYEIVEMPQSARTHTHTPIYILHIHTKCTHIYIYIAYYRPFNRCGKGIINDHSVCVCSSCQEINLLLLVWTVNAENLRLYREE